MNAAFVQWQWDFKTRTGRNPTAEDVWEEATAMAADLLINTPKIQINNWRLVALAAQLQHENQDLKAQLAALQQGTPDGVLEGRKTPTDGAPP